MTTTRPRVAARTAVRSPFTLGGAALAATLGFAPLPAAIAPEAAASGAGRLEEIIVTSRYREETLQQPPLAVSAFTGEALLLRRLDNRADIGPVVLNALTGP